MTMDKVYARIEQRSGDLVEYSDKLRNSIKAIDDIFTPLFTRAGLRYEHDGYFYEEPSISENNPMLLSVEKLDRWCICYRYWDDDIGLGRWIGNASREMLKAAVPALPEFISKYAEFLEKETEEYRVVSEMAEAMSNVVQKAAAKEIPETAEDPESHAY